jgi:hypothetical protein
MGMNAEKSEAMRISRQPSPVQIMIDQQRLQNVEYFNYLCSMLTNDARCTREIKSRSAMAKSSIQQEEDSFHQQTGFKSKEETGKVLHLERSFVWC